MVISKSDHEITWQWVLHQSVELVSSVKLSPQLKPNWPCIASIYQPWLFDCFRLNWVPDIEWILMKSMILVIDRHLRGFRGCCTSPVTFLTLTLLWTPSFTASSTRISRNRLSRTSPDWGPDWKLDWEPMLRTWCHHRERSALMIFDSFELIPWHLLMTIHALLLFNCLGLHLLRSWLLSSPAKLTRTAGISYQILWKEM